MYCPRGKFNFGPGMSSCYAALCPAGKFTDVPNYLKDPHRCTKCPDGKYQPSPHHTRCLDCPVGKWDWEDTTKCGTSDCNPGRYYTKDGCVKCPMGKYSDDMHLSSCRGCGIGQYQFEIGQNGCEINHCLAGRYKTPDDCVGCPVGKFSLPGMTECWMCPAGRYAFHAGSSMCALSSCTPGKFQGSGTSAGVQSGGGCRRCPNGQYSGAVGRPNCSLCNAGYQPAARTSCVKHHDALLPRVCSSISCAAHYIEYGALRVKHQTIKIMKGSSRDAEEHGKHHKCRVDAQAVCKNPFTGKFEKPCCSCICWD
jgi:hypothetical protein